MAVNYTQALSTDMIVSEIEKILDWQTDILRQCLFPAAQNHKADPKPPEGMLNWCRAEQERNTIDRKLVERFSMVYDELAKVAGSLLSHCEGGAALTVELFDAFENQCDAIITQIRRLQQDLGGSSVAVDTTTGLRTVAGIKNDLKREQDRFDRKGTSFSVSAIAVDNLSDLQKKYDRRAMDVIFAHAARVVARTIRSFDDAYYLGRGEYVLVLKHVEFLDACAVMDRLRREIEIQPVQLPGGETQEITASFGICEAQLRENPELIMEHAKSALLVAKDGGGNRVAEYREESKLARFAKDVKGTGILNQ